MRPPARVAPTGLLLALLAGTAAAIPPSPPDRHFKLDQLGYRPVGTKVAVLSDPVTGFDAPDPYTPGPGIEVRRWADDGIALTVAPPAWGGGAVHAQSGDRAWWVDFTALTAPGSYYLWDPAGSRGSGRFEIADDVYAPVLRAALRSFFYQRCGAAKDPAHAGPSWSDAACHLGAEQDLDCRAVLDPRPVTGRDLSGGWHDAGDYNKYVNFADEAIHELLFAFERDPAPFGDDLGIPESGNCVPDILDELRFELDWLLKMQLADGSVLHKVSVTDWATASPPSADAAPRRYAPPTASATISAAGALAHAAIVFATVADPAARAYADTLAAAAIRAWNWLEANPGRIPSSYDNTGFVNAAAEDDPYQQGANRTAAAAYLFALTGDATYRDWFDANYAGLHLIQWGYAYPFEGGYQDGALYYARAAGATPAVAADIVAAFAGSMRNDSLGHHAAGDDAYRAWLADRDYTWGSNATKAIFGSMFESMRKDGLDPPNDPAWREAASAYLHYFHGVNPLGIVFLTNLGAMGAERSVDEFYHGWFTDGSAWDNVRTSPLGPAPGFIPGGANPAYRPDPAYAGPPIEPPMNQPIQKSFRQWNTGWPENSWEVSETQVAMEAAYVRLLAAFAGPAPASGPAPPGNSLRAVRRGPGVELSWSPAGGATSYNVLRCDATAGDCVPAILAPGIVPLWFGDASPPPAAWYQIESVNACGVGR